PPHSPPPASFFFRGFSRLPAVVFSVCFGVLFLLPYVVMLMKVVVEVMLLLYCFCTSMRRTSI
ncbi:hypothetical protein ACEN8K_46905, partial [Variovorax sp. CT11-76]